MVSRAYPAIEMRQSFIECDGCETGNEVLWYCFNCKANPCDGCKGARLHQKHIPSIYGWTSKEAVTARQESYPPCKLHPQKTYTNYCQTCDVPCCPCCMSMHNMHTTFTIEEASASAAEEISSRLSSMEQNDLSQLATVRAKMEALIHENNLDKQRNKEKLKKKIESLKEQLDILEKEENLKIDQRHKDREDKLRSNMLNVDSSEVKINSLIESFTQKMSVGSKVEMKSCLLENPVQTLQYPLIEEGDVPPRVDYVVFDYIIPNAEKSIGTTFSTQVSVHYM